MSPPPQPDPIAPETAAGATALLIVDMISCWDFPDADKLLAGARRVAPVIAQLKARCKRAGVPAIYANDNRGRWRSDFPALVGASLAGGGPAAAITGVVEPSREDYFVLKPSQSAFYGTPLELLLRHLEVKRIVVTGVASDQCVLSTVLDARMRSLAVVVPRDGVATQSTPRNRAVLRQLEEVHQVATTPSARVRLAQRTTS
ncbi:isochorismatase family cysteine hydrolase [Variovorax sp. J22R24]|uniref:isochorismatase family cysteine hydrolase n=1 Tax=Variovorax gracilis TaxID=3053502 RepID=UPI002574B1C0|nr:isochorismatase family cysteine hydrolase [Variovorax sp. J22R24]MDM0108816.1 isochorismatase family cysteine hydrolase [Variovorax sp. J22R24]